MTQTEALGPDIKENIRQCKKKLLQNHFTWLSQPQYQSVQWKKTVGQHLKNNQVNAYILSLFFLNGCFDV